MADLAVFYEHPQWFEALFKTLDRRGLNWTPIEIQDHTFDPADKTLPAPVILNRLAMSSFLRQEEHALYYSMAVLDHWQGLGARVINGPGVLAYVVLPQALRSVVPPLASTFIALFKNSSIASAFGVAEAISVMTNMVNVHSTIVLWVMGATAAIYVALALIFGRAFTWLERKALIVR